MPSLAYMQGMTTALDRKATIEKLQREDREEKAQIAELKRKTDAARQQAIMRGMRPEIANAAGVGELEGWNKVQAEKDAAELKEEGRTIGERDNRAMAAAAMAWDVVQPAAKQYFVSQTKVEPLRAAEVWASIGLGGRGRALGVRHEKTLARADEYDKAMAQEAAKPGLEQTKAWLEEQKFHREEPVRVADIANKTQLTAESQARTVDIGRKAKVSESEQTDLQGARGRDVEYWRGQAGFKGDGVPVAMTLPGGVVVYHVPGDVDPKTLAPKWNRGTPDFMMAGGGEGGPAAAAGTPAPEVTPAPVAGSEVRRKTADGKIAVFDSQTKKFLRYE